MTMRPDRLLCGLGTVFGQPSRKDGRSWSADAFRDWLSLETAIPLLVDHGGLVNSWGVTPRVGMVRRFREVSYPVHGLAVLAEVDHADGWGDSLLADITSVLRQRWLPAAWGFSVAAWVTDDAALPYELSLTRTPAYSDARVLAVGPEALDTFELLADTAATPGSSTADRW